MTAPRPAPALTGRHVVVLGMGRSGVAAARMLVARGARVTGADRRTGLTLPEGVEPALGPHDDALFAGADLVVTSPGVPSTASPLRAARAAGVPIWGEMGLAAALLAAERPLDVVAVTGTNGKSTVATLTGQLLDQAGMRPFVGGNLGRPLSELLDDPEPYGVVVVEVSSYQLELPGGLTPRAAAVLNLTPDHLARHGDMQTYAACKRRLLQRVPTHGFAWLPTGVPLLEGPLSAPLFRLDADPGITDTGDALVTHGTSNPGRLSTAGFSLPGIHNRANLAAAVALSVSAGASLEDLDASTLVGLPHRLEQVAEHSGITWINDSKATNVDAAIVAIEAVPAPQIVLLGGQGKAGEDYGRLRPNLAASARRIICFGASGRDIFQALDGLPAERVASMQDAVLRARALARAPDRVLLAPACASFDEFTDFEARGAAFGEQVARMHRPRVPQEGP